MALDLPPVIGHRGAAALAPENTLAGFRAAAAAGAGWVEFDVKLTADGVAVLIHDDTLERTTDGHGAVARTSAATVATLDAGGWYGAAFRGERVPTLAAAFTALDALGLGANIEIKPCRGRAAETAAAVVDTVVATWPARLPGPLISSFEPECLAVARDRAPQLARGLLLDRLSRGWREAAAELGCSSINLGWRKATPAAVAEVLAAGYTLALWTVNEAVEATRLLAAGASAIITDRPDLLAGRA